MLNLLEVCSLSLLLVHGSENLDDAASAINNYGKKGVWSEDKPEPSINRRSKQDHPFILLNLLRDLRRNLFDQIKENAYPGLMWGSCSRRFVPKLLSVWNMEESGIYPMFWCIVFINAYANVE